MVEDTFKMKKAQKKLGLKQLVQLIKDMNPKIY